jgi:hypothetical protein
LKKPARRKTAGFLLGNVLTRIGPAGERVNGLLAIRAEPASVQVPSDAPD